MTGLLLESINHQRHAGGGVQAVQSQFDYEYTVAGNISRWNQRWNGLSGGADYHLGYDAADQLLGAEVRDPISGVLQKTYGYAYDPAANRTLEQTSTHGSAQQEITLSRASYNSLNQMTSRTGGSEALEVSGTVNELAQVSIAGQPASALWKRSDGQYGFRGTAQVSSGANQVAVTATDGSGWEHRAYWGANQIPWGTDGTESRRYQGPLPATGQWVRLEVDAASVGLSGRSISGMAYSQVGDQADWDHSGKVSATGVETTYVDDALPAGATPYGTWTWGDTGLSTPAAFTGHHYHPRSTLHLAPYPAYSADLGRWLSRDPIEEGGINLYEYSSSNSVAYFDDLSLSPAACDDPVRADHAHDEEPDIGHSDMALDIKCLVYCAGGIVSGLGLLKAITLKKAFVKPKIDRVRALFGWRPTKSIFVLGGRTSTSWQDRTSVLKAIGFLLTRRGVDLGSILGPLKRGFLLRFLRRSLVVVEIISAFRHSACWLVHQTSGDLVEAGQLKQIHVSA